MILNLTQHAASVDQIAAGVLDLPADERAAVSALLTFEDCPDTLDIGNRAAALAELAAMSAAWAPHDGAPADAEVMIGGAPWLMAPLEAELRALHMQPVYAFSRRESVDAIQPDGSVRKTAVFRHAGWVPA